MIILELLMERITAAAILIVLALVSLLLQIFLRHRKLPRICTGIIAGLGAVGALYTLVRPISAILTPGASALSVATVHIPAVLTSLVIAAHFVILIVFDFGKKITVDSNLYAAAISSLQLVFVLFNFVRTFGNYSTGQPELFFIQIILTVLPVFPPLFFFISYKKAKKKVSV
ncbi:hypothetical protein FACS189499_10360 [Clostridia bacterium]|nr:hypothetical protein FACS189499_10360 [Clostridia bacterium]